MAFGKLFIEFEDKFSVSQAGDSVYKSPNLKLLTIFMNSVDFYYARGLISFNSLIFDNKYF